MSFSGPSNQIINNSNLEGLNNSSNSLEMARRTSTNRFEIERVEESSLNRSTTIPEMSGKTEIGDGIPREVSQYTVTTDVSSKPYPASALKKTVNLKHIPYNDSFDFDESNHNTATKKDRAKFDDTLKRNTETEPLTGSRVVDDDDANTSCFQINYDERNKPKSLTCNFNSNGDNSYTNCVHDFKTIALYQKLIAEFIGNYFDMLDNLFIIKMIKFKIFVIIELNVF